MHESLASQPANRPVIDHPILGVGKIVVAAGIGVASKLRKTIAAKRVGIGHHRTMIFYDVDEAIDRRERNFVTCEIKITTSEVWEDIDLLCGVISERKLPTAHRAAFASDLIQGQTERYTSSRGLPPCGSPDGAACFRSAAKLKDRWLVLICLF